MFLVLISRFRCRISSRSFHEQPMRWNVCQMSFSQFCQDSGHLLQLRLRLGNVFQDLVAFRLRADTSANIN